MTEIIIKARKLPATGTDGERVRAAAYGGNVTLTIPFPYSEPDPFAYVAGMLARAYGYGPRVEHVSGQSYRTTTDTMDVDSVAECITEHTGAEPANARAVALELLGRK